MEKSITAIANYTGSENEAAGTRYAPKEAVDKVLAIVETKKLAGGGFDNALSADEYATVKDCLASIGAEENGYGEEESLTGRENVKHTITGGPLSVEASSILEVKDVWEHGRHEWSASMGVRKTGGDAVAAALNFTFRFASFGVSEDGTPIVLFASAYERTFDDDLSLQRFQDGEFVYASEFDVSKFVQWGYLIFAQCEVVSNSEPLYL